MTPAAGSAAMALAVAVPALGAVLSLAWPRLGGSVAVASGAGTALAVAGVVVDLARSGGVARYALGGWGAPLGIELSVDGLSAAMLVLCAVVSLGIGIHASADFRHPGPVTRGRSSGARELRAFRPLALLLWAGLNALFLSGDAFNLYVTLEIVSLCGVALTALAGGGEAVAAALRYLMAGTLASFSYLLGVGLLYAEHSTLDLVTLGVLVPGSETGRVAMPLILTGLAVKCALFPLHGWLPNAHANAPSPVSAALSALVVKAALYLILRWWLDVLSPGLVASAIAWLLAGLGGAAVLWGSIQALLAARLKLVVAYSTVAQMGYPFLAFPLALDPRFGGVAWSGAIVLALAHGLAKSAMFLAAGNVLRAFGHDRLDSLAGIGARAPISAFAMGLGAVSLVGLPFSGGFAGKWMLMEAALRAGQWWCVLVIATGTLLGAAYMLRALGAIFAQTSEAQVPALPARMEWSALVLATLAVALGFVVPALEPLLALGAPLAGGPGLVAR